MIEFKKCIVCEEVKPVESFYKHPATADRLFNKCKRCHNDYALSRIRTPEGKAVFRKYQTGPKMKKWRKEYQKKYRKTERGIEIYHDAAKKYAANNAEKRVAVNAVNNAIRAGIIKRGPCIVCGKKKTHAHHEDYEKKLDVIWLCPKHHVAHHRGSEQLFK